MNTYEPTVLVVDDDVDTCHNLKDILTDMGYEVDTAHSGPEALALIRDRPYDVALLDLKMPGMDGLTLYREIRRLRADTVAMIVSAYTTPEVADEALDAGAWQVLSKPVDFSRLLSLVEEATRQPLVMVVDDDPDLCQNLWDLLRQHAYRVALAGSEEEAAERLTHRDFQVVLIDLKLPGGDGRSVIRKVKEQTPEARTLLITGHRDEMSQLVDEAIHEGAGGVCYKPFDVPRLLELLNQLAHRNG